MGAIRTHKDIFETVNYHELKSNIIIIDGYDLQLEKAISEIRKNDNIHELAVEA